MVITQIMQVPSTHHSNRKRLIAQQNERPTVFSVNFFEDPAELGGNGIKAWMITRCCLSTVISRICFKVFGHGFGTRHPMRRLTVILVLSEATRFIIKMTSGWHTYWVVFEVYFHSDRFRPAQQLSLRIASPIPCRTVRREWLQSRKMEPRIYLNNQS
jgi:hypothetical protein